jgi:hypothetical protein
LSRWKISFPIDGLYEVIKKNDPELLITSDKAQFHYRGDQIVGSVVVDSNSNTQQEALQHAKYLINKSLSKLCFAYNNEPSIIQNSYYVIDMSDSHHRERITKSLSLRWSNIWEDPQSTLSKIEMLPPEKLNVLDLALAYYKLGEFRNPLRIESFFSSITVIVRDIANKDYVKTGELKKQLKHILRIENGTEFNETEFENDWKDCYADERCSISHGKGSKLIDPRMHVEHDKLVEKVHSWARKIIYYYIKFNANTRT